MKMNIRPMKPEERAFSYSQDMDIMEQAAVETLARIIFPKAENL